MFEIKENYLSAEKCNKLLSLLKKNDDSFAYRTGAQAHLGFDGSESKYSNMWIVPDEITNFIRTELPKEHKENYNQVILNRYREGDFMLEHIDAGGHIRNAVLILEDSDNGFMYRDKNGNEHLVKDKQGNLIDFNSLGLRHRVPVIKDGSKTRYTVISVFRL